MSDTRLPYRPALDGLRGLAVAAVVGYHLDLPGFSGGFLGVDVFLVVSGYLITALLLAERDASVTGRIDLRRFWVRRARRLLPALVVVVFAVAAWGHLAAPPATLDRLRADGLAALAYVANWRFVASDQSYFDTFLDASPLRHLWSLSVEEQWYLVWPLAVVALAWATRGRRNAFVPILLAGATASAVWMALLFDIGSDPSRGYYGTDTRAQALLVGAALAAWRWRGPRHESRLEPWTARRDGLAALGLVAVAAAVVLADDAAPWMYRGGFFGVALASVAAVAVAAEGRGPVAAALGTPLLAAVGRRSYGIYLWHWPVVVACTEATLGLDGVALLLARLALTVALAEASYRLVERPVREGRWPLAPVITGGAFAAGTSFVLLLTLATPPSTRPLTVQSLRPTVSTVPPSSPTTPVATAAPGTTSAPAVEPATEPLRVLLVGDSQAVTLGASFTPGMAGPGIDVQGQADVGCGVVADAYECESWREEWTAALELVRPDVVVVLLGAWEVLDHRVDGGWLRFGDERWGDTVRGSLEEALHVAAGTGAPVAVLGVPCFGQAAGSQFGTEQRNEMERVATVNAMLTEIATTRPGMHVLDYGSLVCPSGKPHVDVGGSAARPDGVHLGPEGAQLTWSWLGPQLRSLISTDVPERLPTLPDAAAAGG